MSEKPKCGERVKPGAIVVFSQLEHKSIHLSTIAMNTILRSHFQESLPIETKCYISMCKVTLRSLHLREEKKREEEGEGRKGRGKGGGGGEGRERRGKGGGRGEGWSIKSLSRAYHL